jgi:predicted MFS family arabinose efflux permease
VLGFTHSFLQMLLARIALGLGVSVCIPTAHSLLMDYVPEEHRPFALGLHSAGGVVAATLCVALGGYLAAHFGWRETLWIIAVSGVALGILMMILLREPARRSSGSSASAPQIAAPALNEVVRHLLATRSYMLVLVACCFAMLIEFGSSQWLPSYYVRQFSLPVEDVGLRYGLALGFGGVPGSFLGGWAVARLAVRDVRWLVWFPAAMYAVALPTGLAMLLVSNANLAICLNGLYAFAIYTTSGAFWAALFVGVPSRMRSSTSAITLLIAGLTGLTLGPILTGGLSELWSSVSGSRSLQPALISIESLGVCVIVPLMLAARHLSSRATPAP